ncbi:hypothetical protein BDP27DRAFT_1428290 [Rhodocollybia butyracea]|uniref:Uncharacterized protein n=1 Tax=Rhodocollybia butyracea TaxID=206335 RepID=A0A9P5U0Q1_9AGAR|nr:hypothetical protein BDP27DRAFT_1428290 [Rhodocollybia butyracea]
MSSPDFQYNPWGPTQPLNTISMDEGLLPEHPQSPNSASMDEGVVPRAAPAPWTFFAYAQVSTNRAGTRRIPTTLKEGYRDTVQDQKWDLKNLRSLQNEKITQLKAELAASDGNLRDARESIRKVVTRIDIFFYTDRTPSYAGISIT